MKQQIEEVGSGHYATPERKTDPLDIWIDEHYDPEAVDLFKALMVGGNQHSGHAAFIETVKRDIELFSAVRDETYNHDQFMEMRSLVKYLSALTSRAERVVVAAKMDVREETPEITHPKVGPRVY